ncbi:hypothetical protein RAAC3_TM7C00001G0771 [Candidatus Saccharibacteria bacterium RAAC3_TM7_1]|nr:hypothetical protein RAAC3_TM7C00001G0771 [Candidatus Saccharibacteria bacterium RAAC3_TM7_1]
MPKTVFAVCERTVLRGRKIGGVKLSQGGEWITPFI